MVAVSLAENLPPFFYPKLEKRMRITRIIEETEELSKEMELALKAVDMQKQD